MKALTVVRVCFGVSEVVGVYAPFFGSGTLIIGTWVGPPNSVTKKRGPKEVQSGKGLIKAEV